MFRGTPRVGLSVERDREIGFECDLISEEIALRNAKEEEAPIIDENEQQETVGKVGISRETVWSKVMKLFKF